MSATEPEPTLADVLAAINGLRTEVVKDLRAEMKIGFLEARANLSDFRLSTNERFESLNIKVNTVIDALTNLRREFEDHWHPEPET